MTDLWDQEFQFWSGLLTSTRAAGSGKRQEKTNVWTFYTYGCADLNAHSDVYIPPIQTVGKRMDVIPSFHFFLYDAETQWDRERWVWAAFLGFYARTCCATSARWLIRVQAWWRSKGGRRELESERYDGHNHSSSRLCRLKNLKVKSSTTCAVCWSPATSISSVYTVFSQHASTSTFLYIYCPWHML